MVEVFVVGSQHNWGQFRGRFGWWDITDFLTLLRLKVLREAVLWDTSIASLHGLHRFTPQLEGLLLHEPHRLPAEAADTLAALPQLRRLELRVAAVQPREWEALLQLQQLTRLVLVPCVVLLADWKEGSTVSLHQLTRLSQLRQLSIGHRGTLYGIEQEELYHEQSGTLLVPSTASFPALEHYELSLQTQELYDWRFQMGGAQFIWCEVSHEEQARAGGGRGATFLVDRLSRLPGRSLQQLLDAALPPGRPLASLFLLNTGAGVLQEEALQGCQALQQVSYLELESCPVSDAALAALLQQAPRLEELGLVSYFDGDLPPCLLAKRGLERLRLKQNSLRELPDGPYLQDVRWLSLAGNKFASLPRLLASATSLEYLEMHRNPDLALRKADVKADEQLLSSLPHLAVLMVDSDLPNTFVLEHLIVHLPWLEVWCCSGETSEDSDEAA